MKPDSPKRKAVCDDDFDWSPMQRDSMTVYGEEREPREFAGLYDAGGKRLYRENRRIGFQVEKKQ